MSEDFSKGKRGPVINPDPNKVRITIRLDADIIEHFKKIVHKSGGGNYQTLINDALREHSNGPRFSDSRLSVFCPYILWPDHAAIGHITSPS